MNNALSLAKRIAHAFPPETLPDARGMIARLWPELHHQRLLEFSRAKARHHLLKYLARTGACNPSTARYT